MKKDPLKGKSSHWGSSVHDVRSSAGRLAKDKSNFKVRILRDLAEVTQLKSVAELGCALGHWLIAAKELGVEEIHGYDIPEIDVSERLIGAEKFTAADLGQPFNFPSRFDLVIATEVAEHIPVSQADVYIANAAAAGPLILFSAATPYQGGMGHANENWVEYWDHLFNAEGYVCFDFIRDRIWHDPGIPFFYRQNLLLYANREKARDLKAAGLQITVRPRTLIHPEMLIKSVHRTYPVNKARHSIENDVAAYYACTDDFRELEIENQNYGDKSFGE